MRKVPDWLREERRNALGHWAAFCLTCGYTQRYFEELESELPPVCPTCGGQLCARCRSCGARFASAFVVDCEACGAAIRPRELFGTRIRRPDQ